jgi:2-keto-3-deoxy-galactonokinase
MKKQNHQPGVIWSSIDMIPKEWKNEPRQEQRNLLNSACGDLANQISWHGNRLSKDDWRHMLSGTVLGWRMVPAIDRGQGAAGFIFLGGSSLDLSKEQCSEAIDLAFSIGDDPESQGIKAKPVRWCTAVCGARWIQAE